MLEIVKGSNEVGRKEYVVRVLDEGRDQGKVFLLTEMSALKAERWATKAGLASVAAALAKGIDLGVADPTKAAENGMAFVAFLGSQLFANLDYGTATELLDEMMTCVKIVADGKNKLMARTPYEDEYGEVKTLVQLREAVFEMHTGFSVSGFLLRMKENLLRGNSENSPGIQTSPAQ